MESPNVSQSLRIGHRCILGDRLECIKVQKTMMPPFLLLFFSMQFGMRNLPLATVDIRIARGMIFAWRWQFGRAIDALP